MKKYLTLMIVFLSMTVYSQQLNVVFESSGTIKLDSTQLANGLIFETAIPDGDYVDVIVSSDGTVLSLAANVINSTHIPDGSLGSNELSPTGVVAGTYTNPNVTVNSKGQIEEIHDGVGGGSVTTIVTPAYKGSFPSISEANANGVDNTEGNYVYVVTEDGFDFTEGDLFTVYKNPLIHGSATHTAFNNTPMFSTKAIGLATVGFFEFFLVYLEAGGQFEAYQNDGANGLFFFHGIIETEFDATLENELAIPQSGITTGSFNVAHYYNGTYRFDSTP